MTEFRLMSDAFAADGYFSKEQELNDPAFGASGGNRSPALRWEGVPDEAKSLALTVYDPDAPTGSGFWHWVVVNLPVATRSLPMDAGRAAGDLLPPGAVQMANDYGLPGFGGFAPPKGDKPHRYIFRIHALKVASLPLDAHKTNAVARFMLHLNEIDSATVTGLYEIS
ncbi:YbhB/YbcL family Raf kinase inhibitor-like protein [Robbsia sp. Bb-Pol-6]|uniref:YbhB/YbcL family Raf kinase inhibitor-like protein n=1 Tax=Robbsia betulipollinis TaxID=2981849 RepID=A0ABT3ZM74_9BURK|nr:YbhB/YbcL family Raf kinase inhibitor-like protein [Robbsia betulipollinis]MCY0387639.1 YbhB/YbcL family Raf kinase inhibitor-like protein [Robbsia betulipollinis]